MKNDICIEEHVVLDNEKEFQSWAVSLQREKRTGRFNELKGSGLVG